MGRRVAQKLQEKFTKSDDNAWADVLPANTGNDAQTQGIKGHKIQRGDSLPTSSARRGHDWGRAK